MLIWDCLFLCQKGSKMLKDLLAKEGLKFQDVLDFIGQTYDYTPSGFKNGNLYNNHEQNQGSAKVLFLAKLSKLSEEDTLKLFAEHYQNVLENLAGETHQNIRNFIESGWEGVKFDGVVLTRSIHAKQ